MVPRAALPLLAVLALLPASASAAPPWPEPQAVDGLYAGDLLTTARGDRLLIGAGASRRGDADQPTVLASLGADGAETGRQQLEIAHERAATFGDRVVVAGSRPAANTREAERAPVLVASGPAGALGAPRALPGTRGQWVSSLAGRGATVALVTMNMYYRGRPVRTLWVRRGGRFERVLTIHPGPNARETAVAVGRRGDVLMVWQERRAIRAVHVDRRGRAGRAQTIGRGVQSALQANLASGRMEVAWMSQRVGEGDAHSPARVAYTSARRGGRFGRARTVGRSTLLGTGHYVMRPGVRLEPAGGDRSLLAWTSYDGERFRVRAADVEAGAVAKPQTVSSPGDDAVLGDVAAGPKGALVAWLTGTRGADPSGPQHVAAAVRAPGAPAFGPAEQVSEENVPVAPFTAIDAAGRPLAAWNSIEQRAFVAMRPGP